MGWREGKDLLDRLQANSPIRLTDTSVKYDLEQGLHLNPERKLKNSERLAGRVSSERLEEMR